MNIRHYSPDDFGRCVELFVEVFNGEPWNDAWSSEKAGQYLSDFIHTPGFKGVVAEQEETIEGFIIGSNRKWWQGDEFFIHEMCVRSGLQRSGIGSGLMEYLEQALLSEGVRHLALLTDRGVPAEFFYKKNGFKEIPRLVFLAKNNGDSL